MTFKRKKFGTAGEESACRFLEDRGYRILARNFRNSLGEIDVIAKQGQTICFIEVKARASDRFGDPAQAVSFHKRRKISQVALAYLKANRLTDVDARFDVVSVLGEGENAVVELIEDAFELSAPYAY